MSDRESNSLGRILALVLRHAPEKFGVEMDLNGWVNSRELSEAIQNQRRHFHWLRVKRYNTFSSCEAWPVIIRIPQERGHPQGRICKEGAGPFI